MIWYLPGLLVSAALHAVRFLSLLVLPLGLHEALWRSADLCWAHMHADKEIETESGRWGWTYKCERCGRTRFEHAGLP